MFECLVPNKRNCLRRIKKYGLVGLGFNFVEDVYHWGYTLSFQKHMSGQFHSPSYSTNFGSDVSSQLVTTMLACLTVAMFPIIIDNVQ